MECLLSIALDTPAASLEDDALAPSFGPDTVLGTLERRDSTFRLSRPSCPESMPTYRLQLTSGLTVQTVEGHLPLPARALGRKQATVPLDTLLDGFLSWSDGGEGTRTEAPATQEAAVAACTTTHTACGFVVTLGDAGAARARAQRALKGSCIQGHASPCVGWTELLGTAAPTAIGKSKLPSQEVQEALARV